MSGLKLNLRQLEVFHAVITMGSATEAAKLLNTTQPAVSKMIANTEEIIGFDLFKRVNRRLMPTPEALD
ncbi:MAG: LysR family transcriptional regulator, partial [Alphaproteobacteria bacterium]|nr:LysR family transcriptional regulator [Alphaproteobacteria bacterium]